MSRQLEQVLEIKQAKRSAAIVAAVEFELADAVGHSGAVLLGFSARLLPGECLLTLRVELAGRRQVAFVGAEDHGSALMKAVRLARADKLGYKADKFGGQS